MNGDKSKGGEVFLLGGEPSPSSNTSKVTYLVHVNLQNSSRAKVLQSTCNMHKLAESANIFTPTPSSPILLRLPK